MPSTCQFELDRPDPIYFGGETISGHIVLRTTKSKAVNAGYILFEGVAKVRWEELSSCPEVNLHKDKYRGDETYISSRTNVLEKCQLPPGIHTYSFYMPLPLACPTSCVQEYGKITYEISLILDRPWRSNNVFKKPITVLQSYNLNYRPELLIPLRAEYIKNFCCWPFSSGLVISTLTIPFGGYAPGQQIHYTLEIDNQSKSYNVDGVHIFLIQTYEFMSKKPSRKIKKQNEIRYQEFLNERVQSLSKRRINASLLIPPVPPTSPTQGIIKVSYRIAMSIKTNDCNKHPKTEIPIIIGTIPLDQSVENRDHVTEWILQTADTQAEAATDLPPNYNSYNINKHNGTDVLTPPEYTNFTAPSAPPEEAIEIPLLPVPYKPSAPPLP